MQSEAIRPEGDGEERAVSVQSETRVGCASTQLMKKPLRAASLCAAVDDCPVKAGYIDTALSHIQGFAWAIADNDGPVSAFCRSHAEPVLGDGFDSVSSMQRRPSEHGVSWKRGGFYGTD
jgi:hypothetical protein